MCEHRAAMARLQHFTGLRDLSRNDGLPLFLIAL
jgi:hypothetical protein